ETLDPNGRLSGNVQIISKDYARLHRVLTYMSDTSAYVNDELKNGTENIEIGNFKMENRDADSVALRQTFSLSGQIQSTGEYSFLDLNLLSAYRKNPFVADKRYSDIDFAFKRSVNINVVVQIPGSYTI